MFTSCNLNDQISFSLGCGRSRDYLSRIYCLKKVILHINRQLEAKGLGKRLNLEKKTVQNITYNQDPCLNLDEHATYKQF